MSNIYKRSKVINSNDLSQIKLNGQDVVVTTNIYSVVSPEPDDGGYVEVRRIDNDKTIYIKKDLLIPVY